MIPTAQPLDWQEACFPLPLPSPWVRGRVPVQTEFTLLDTVCSAQRGPWDQVGGLGLSPLQGYVWGNQGGPQLGLPSGAREAGAGCGKAAGGWREDELWKVSSQFRLWQGLRCQFSLLPVNPPTHPQKANRHETNKHLFVSAQVWLLDFRACV